MSLRFHFIIVFAAIAVNLAQDILAQAPTAGSPGWPADYRTSGVMTFVISHHGKLFEKDYGPDILPRWLNQ